jgi:catechol 2,3-dioxygenase-like lactoylglutathione lyase family enzyme
VTEDAALAPSGVVGRHVTGVHHVGIPVRDLERSLAWYEELFGLQAQFVGFAGGVETSRLVGLDDARLRFAFLPLGDTLIEFLEYEHPVGHDFDRRNCDVGAVHLCFEVDDIERAYRVLAEQGVEFSIRPLRLHGPLEGQMCCYFRDPDGIQLELWQRHA